MSQHEYNFALYYNPDKNSTQLCLLTTAFDPNFEPFAYSKKIPSDLQRSRVIRGEFLPQNFESTGNPFDFRISKAFFAMI